MAMCNLKTANEMWEFLQPKRAVDRSLLVHRIVNECRFDAYANEKMLPVRMQELKTIADT